MSRQFLKLWVVQHKLKYCSFSKLYLILNSFNLKMSIIDFVITQSVITVQITYTVDFSQ